MNRPEWAMADDLAPSGPAPPKSQPFALPSPPLRRDNPSIALRPWGVAPTDPDTLVAAWSDPDVARWTLRPDVRTRDVAAAWVAAEGSRRADGVALDLVITESGAPEVVIGEVGLVLVQAERRWAEVGYWLFPQWRGQGRATAALDLFTEWALRVMPIQRLLARTHVDNPASSAVAKRAGYELAGELATGMQVWVIDATVTV